MAMRKSIFKVEEDNEPRVNLKHLVHYTLLWIVYIDNYYNIHKTLKARNYKYPVRMYWMPSELKYRNAKFMHKWHPTKE